MPTSHTGLGRLEPPGLPGPRDVEDAEEVKDEVNDVEEVKDSYISRGKERLIHFNIVLFRIVV
jgi:hypothetical protein